MYINTTKKVIEMLCNFLNVQDADISSNSEIALLGLSVEDFDFFVSKLERDFNISLNEDLRCPFKYRVVADIVCEVENAKDFKTHHFISTPILEENSKQVIYENSFAYGEKYEIKHME